MMAKEGRKFQNSFVNKTQGNMKYFDFFRQLEKERITIAYSTVVILICFQLWKLCE
jgi:hypothetical protein